MTETQQLRQSVSRWRALTIIVATVQLSGWMFVLGCGSGATNSTPKGQLSAAQADTQDEIICKKLTIVDDDGKTIATLGPLYSGDKSANLNLYNQHEGNYASVSPLLGFSHQTGKQNGTFSSLGLYCGDEVALTPKQLLEKSDLMIKRSSGKLTEQEMKTFENFKKLSARGDRFSLTHSANGGQLSIYNKDGSLSTQINSLPLGGGYLSLFNPLGKEVVNLQSNKTNEGSIFLSDVHGERKPVIPYYIPSK
jgi:hypothetical protein